MGCTYETLSKNRTKQTVEKNCSVLLKTVYLGMSIGQEKKYPKWRIKGKDLGESAFLGENFHPVLERILSVIRSMV